MTIECNPPSATKRHLREINLLEEKHTQDIQRREEEFRLQIDQLKFDSMGQARISSGVEDGGTEEKEDESVGNKKITEGVKHGDGVEVVMDGSGGEEKIHDDNEVMRSRNIEEALRTDLKHSEEEIMNLRYRVFERITLKSIFTYLIFSQFFLHTL